MTPQLEAATRKIIEKIDKANAPEVDILTGILIGELRPFLNLESLKARPEAVSEAIIRYSNAVLGIGVKMGIRSVMELVDAAKAEELDAKPGSQVQ